MRRSGGSRLPKLPLGLVLARLLAAAATATFRVGALPKLTLRADRPALGRATAVQLTAEEGGRGLSAVRLELLQGDRPLLLIRRTYTARPPWAFWGARPERHEVKGEGGTDPWKGLPAG